MPSDRDLMRRQLRQAMTENAEIAARHGDPALRVDLDMDLLAMLFPNGLPPVRPIGPCTPIGYARDGTPTPMRGTDGRPLSSSEVDAAFLSRQ